MNESKFRKALQQLSEEAIPSTLDMWTRIEKRLPQDNHQQAQQSSGVSRLRVVGKLAQVTLIVALLATVVIWFVRPQQSISASQILLNAIQAQQKGITGLKSYQGVIHKQLDNGTTQIEEHIWAAIPSKHRVEVYMKPTPQRVIQQLDPSMVLSTPVDNTLTLHHIDIGNAADHYWYSTELHGAIRMATYPYPGLDLGIVGGMYGDGVGIFAPLVFYNPTDLNSLLDAVNKQYTQIQLAGTETLAGRPVYVLKYISQWTIPNIPKNFNVTMWVDQAFYLLLGERWETTDGKLINEWRFSSIEVNPALSNTLFAFEPATKVLVLNPYVELYTQLTDYQTRFDMSKLLTQTSFTQLVNTVKAQVDYKVFLPASYTALPGLMPSLPIYNSTGGNEITIKYQTADNGMALVIIQGLPNVMKQFDPCTQDKDVKCESITIGNLTGHYYEDTEKSSIHLQIGTSFGRDDVQEAQVRWLGFEKDGTQLLIRAEHNPRLRNYEVSKADMLTVATSLQEAK